MDVNDDFDSSEHKSPRRDPKLDQIDKSVHAAIRAWGMALGEEVLPVWRESPEWARVSTRASVDHVLKYPEITPAALHAFWLKHRRTLTDATVGLCESNERSINSNFEYSNLSAMEQGKDILFIELVRALIT